MPRGREVVMALVLPAAPADGRLDRHTVPEPVLAATRGLFWVTASTDVRHIAMTLVDRLGGTVVPARLAGDDALPVDVSFGDGEPVVPTADDRECRADLSRYLPAFIEDAQRALEWCRQAERLARDATFDPLTGLANRRRLGRALGRLVDDDTVILLDLDHFKDVNDTFGHAGGDAVLRSLGRIIDGSIRTRDLAGRYGGEEFLFILHDGCDAAAFLRRLQAAWVAGAPHPVTFSAGIAPAAPGRARAVNAADRALYRAKEAGRDRWHWATAADYR